MLRAAFLIFFCLTLYSVTAAQSPKPICPTINVNGPAGIVQPGERFFFTGTVDGELSKNASFQWEVSKGKIIEGQGTLQISVDADHDRSGGSITATLSVLGLPDGCPRSASEALNWDDLPPPVLIDEFGRLANNKIDTRLNKFFTELSNNPNSQGYIINYGTDREIDAREKLITSRITFRDFDRSRITLVRGGTHESGTVYTKLYRVPPGADNPVP